MMGDPTTSTPSATTKQDTAEENTARPPRLDALWIALGALLAYVSMGQEVFYKNDGQDLVLMLVYGQIKHHLHLSYMPLLSIAHALVTPLGVSPYSTAVGVSALGTATGVFFVHQGFRELGATRMQALFASLLVACCPAVFFFATVVEFHGPFFAFAGLTFFGWTRFVRRPATMTAIVLGLFTMLAFAMHSSASLLLGLLLPWFFALRYRELGPRRALLLCAITILTFAIALYLLQALARSLGLLAGPGNAFRHLHEGLGLSRDLRWFPRVVWQEWGLPFFPLCLTGFAGLFVHRTRPEALAYLVGLLPYLAVAQLLLVGDPEFGAYFLPLAIPAAWLTVRALPPLPLVGAILISLVLAVREIWVHDEPHAMVVGAGFVGRLTNHEPSLVLTGHHREAEACLIYLPQVRPYPLYVTTSEDPAIRELLPSLRALLPRELGSGNKAYLTYTGSVYLSEPRKLVKDPSRERVETSAALLNWLKTTFELRELVVRGFPCAEIRTN